MPYKYFREFISSNLQDTIKIGKKLAKALPNGSVVCLVGDLGSGKTTLVKGVAEGLNIKEKVLSPTFNIMKIYSSGERPLIHIDAYRLEDNDFDIGLGEFIGLDSGLTFVEWPKYIANLIKHFSPVFVDFKVVDGIRNIQIYSDSFNVLELQDD